MFVEDKSCSKLFVVTNIFVTSEKTPYYFIYIIPNIHSPQSLTKIFNFTDFSLFNMIKLIKIDANLYIRMTTIERELQGKNYKVGKNDNQKALFLLINKIQIDCTLLS